MELRVFFFEKLHNLSYWERKDFTICEYAKVRRKIMQPFYDYFGDISWVRIEIFGEHYLGLHSKLVINISLFWL
jgi:hypothetical protein